jgi:hypothetical protein
MNKLKIEDPNGFEFASIVSKDSKSTIPPTKLALLLTVDY